MTREDQEGSSVSQAAQPGAARAWPQTPGVAVAAARLPSSLHGLSQDDRGTATAGRGWGEVRWGKRTVRRGRAGVRRGSRSPSSGLQGPHGSPRKDRAKDGAGAGQWGARAHSDGRRALGQRPCPPRSGRVEPASWPPGWRDPEGVWGPAAGAPGRSGWRRERKPRGRLNHQQSVFSARRGCRGTTRGSGRGATGELGAQSEGIGGPVAGRAPRWQLLDPPQGSRVPGRPRPRPTSWKGRRPTAGLPPGRPLPARGASSPAPPRP